MSHILIVGCGPAGLSAALRLAERGQKVTLASAKPPIYHRCAGLPGIDLPEDAAQELRAMGAQSLSGHEVMHALNRRLLRYESNGHIRLCEYHRLLKLAVGDGRCCGGVLLNERTGRLEGVPADAVLLATGGMHTMFSENRFGNDGLASALAFQAGASLRNPDQMNTSGRYPIFEGGLITSWDGETTVPGLYAAGECAEGTALAFPFSQAMATGTAAADAIAVEAIQADPLEAGCAVTESVNALQQLIDVFRKTKGTRAPAVVERRIRETVQRTMTGGRTARLLQRGLLDIRVMRQQAGRGEYDLGEGLYPVLRLPSLLYLLEIMLTTAAFRLLRQDGDLTAVLRGGKIDVTVKRSAAVEAAAYVPEKPIPTTEVAPGDSASAARDALIGVGSELQNAAASEFAAKYSARPAKQEEGAEAVEKAAPAEEAAVEAPEAPSLDTLPPTDDTISFRPVRAQGQFAAQAEPPVGSASPQAPAPAAEAVPSPEPVPVAASEPEPKPAPEPPSVLDMMKAFFPETEPAPETDPITAPEPEAQSETVLEPPPASEPESTPELIPVAVQITMSEMLDTSEPEAVPVQPEAVPAAKPEAVPAAEAETVPAEPETTIPESIHAEETVLDPTPGGEPEPMPAAQEPTVFSTEFSLEFDAANPPEPSEPAGKTTEKGPFAPDPEALLALAKSRRAQEQAEAAPQETSKPVRRESAAPQAPAKPEALAGRFVTFEPDPEALLSMPREE